MNFDDVYTNHKSRISAAEKNVRADRDKLHRYMAGQDEQVRNEEARSAGKVSYDTRPEASVESNGMTFSWRFWDGTGHYNQGGSQSDLRRRGSFSWLPSKPGVIHTSGTDVIESDIRLDDFVSMDLVEHMAILMSESLIALTKSKYPYIE